MSRAMGGGGFGGGSRGGGGGGARGGGGYSRLGRSYGTRYLSRGYDNYKPYNPLWSTGWRFVSTIVVIAVLVSIMSGLMFIGPIVDGSFFEDKIVYDEATFDNYANTSYYEVFAETPKQENNILIVLLVYEGYDGYHCISYGGDELNVVVRSTFDNKFKSTVTNNIPRYYETSFGKNLAHVVDTMASYIPAIKTDESNVSSIYSKTHNRSSFEFDEKSVNQSLADFTKKTGVNIAIVVDEGEDVFGIDKGFDKGLFMVLTIAPILIGATIIVVLVVRKKRIEKEITGEENFDLY